MPDEAAANAIATDAPRYPAGRYGRRRDPAARSRLPLIIIGTVMVAASIGVSWGLYTKYGPQDYRATAVSWSDATADQIVITFRVHKPAGKPAVCQVRARNRAGIEVGFANVPVPAGDSNSRHVTVTYTLPTTDQAFIGEVPRCSAP